MSIRFPGLSSLLGIAGLVLVGCGEPTEAGGGSDLATKDSTAESPVSEPSTSEPRTSEPRASGARRIAAGAAQSSGVPQGHIYTGITGEPTSLNPFVSVDAVTRRYVIPFTHDTLVDVEPTNGSPRGLLSTSWREFSNESTVRPVYEFALRRNVTFSDGRPLTPEDVLFTWEVYRAIPDPGTIVRGLSGVHDARLAKGPDGHSVLHVELKRDAAAPAGIQAALVVAKSWVVVQKSQWLEWLGGSDFDGNQVAAVKDAGHGTGPYVCAPRDDGSPAWRPRRDLRLSRSDASWHRRERPEAWNLGGFHFLFDRQESHAMGLLRGTKIDWYSAGGGLDGLLEDEKVAANYRKLTYSAPHLGHFAITWNVARPGLADRRVRRALTMLFDRQTILDEFLGGNGRVATSYWPVAASEYPKRDPLPFDPKAAGLLLQEAGFGPGGKPLEIEVLAPAGPAFYRQVLELGMDACRRVGVTLVPRIIDNTLLLDRRSKGTFDGVLSLTNHGSHPDPSFIYHSGDRGSANIGGYANPDVDRVLDQLAAVRPGPTRDRLVASLDTLTHDDQPITFLLHPQVAILFNRSIQGAEPGPRGLWPETFWVPAEQQRR